MEFPKCTEGFSLYWRSRREPRSADRRDLHPQGLGFRGQGLGLVYGGMGLHAALMLPVHMTAVLTVAA